MTRLRSRILPTNGIFFARVCYEAEVRNPGYERCLPILDWNPLVDQTSISKTFRRKRKINVLSLATQINGGIFGGGAREC